MQEENLKTIVFKSMNSSTSVFDKAGKSKIIFMTLPNLAQPSRHVKRQHIKMAALKDPGSLEALCQGYIFALDFHHYHTEHEHCLWRFRKHGFPNLFSLEALYYSIRVFMGCSYTEDITGISEFEVLFCKKL